MVDELRDRIPDNAGQFLPPMLADFECEHGRIGKCEKCEEEAEA